MGVVNVTPDSFSDGGRLLDPGRAVAAAHAMVEDGAAIIDIGGESTRPGADPISLEEERRRVMPVLKTLVGQLDVPLSIDTSKPELMTEAAASGVGMINDVYGLRAPGAVEAAAASGAAICVMHMLGEPRTMQHAPHYDDVIVEVAAFLADRVSACRAAGVSSERLLIDPGFGFGKSLSHNLSLLMGLERLRYEKLPILVGLSRKRMLEQLTGRAVGDRLVGSVSLALLAAERGANIIRVHDVGATRDALAILDAVRTNESKQP